nr:FlgD immunoglobulin-like domain containing protein [Paenalcaligenes hominis]
MSTADKVTVNILNNGGSVVREIELDIREAGVYSFEWMGAITPVRCFLTVRTT